MLRILFIDDDPDIAMVASALLEEADHHVTLASNGRDGLAIALQERPEVIITDYMMPVLSGLDMIRQARDAGYDNPIILCSAVPELDLPKPLPAYDAFLEKPYHADGLMAAIGRVRKRLGGD